MQLTHPRTLKIAAISTATAALMSLGLGAASAHIEVTPEATAEGGSTQLTFRVPGESKTAKTTKVKVDLPVSTPFSSVRAKPIAGWTAQIVKGKLPKPVTVNGATVTEAPLSVTWTATDPQQQLSDQQYQTFSIFAGRLPTSGTTVMLPIVQTYSDGSVRNWDDPVVEGKDEPQDPAPSFVTTAAAAGGGHAETAAPEQAAEPRQRSRPAHPPRARPGPLWSRASSALPLVLPLCSRHAGQGKADSSLHGGPGRGMKPRARQGGPDRHLSTNLSLYLGWRAAVAARHPTADLAFSHPWKPVTDTPLPDQNCGKAP